MLVHYSDAVRGWANWALAHPEFGSSVNPITTGGQIMPTSLLLANPDLKTQRHLCVCTTNKPGLDSLPCTEYSYQFKSRIQNL